MTTISRLQHHFLMRSGWSIVAIVLFSFCAVAEGASMLKERPVSYNYLMYSDPMTLRFSNGDELKLMITGRATMEQDHLTLAINDKAIETRTLNWDHKRATFFYKEEGVELKISCVALEAQGGTVNHTCRVFDGEDELGKLLVNKRIYKKDMPKY